MEIQLSPRHPHSIKAYCDTAVSVGDQTFTRSFCLSAQKIHYPWSVESLKNLNRSDLAVLEADPISIILIGHNTPTFAPLSLITELSTQGIGLECMSIAAACRTFNVLLDEKRSVGLGIIL
jgi:uncharacterized protein